jgi:divalent metal cation (Fe/Co/Zn/Cd) transporter
MTAQATVGPEPRRDNAESHDAHFAMRLSLILGFAMLIGKTAAFFLTHSSAIFSDAAESVIHVIAVGFASFTLRLSTRPASHHFLYGY